MRVLLIGAGAIAHHHAAAARLIPAEAILAADPSAEARARFSAAYPEAGIFETPEAMLASAPAGRDDIVVVAVPPWLHAPMTLMAFEAGFHVLCEKPVARTLAELDGMLAAAETAGRRLGDCAIRFNGQPSMRRASALIGEGALGQLNLVRMIHRSVRGRPGIEYQPASRWFLDPDLAGGGVLVDWSVYDLAMLFDVLRPTEVRVDAAHLARIEGRDDPPDHPPRVESHVAAMLRLVLPDGATVPCLYERANGVNGPAHAELSVEGTTGGLSWQWLPPYDGDATRVTRFVDGGGKVEREVETLPMGEHPHFHHQPLLAMAAAVAGRPSNALAAADLRFNFAVIAAIQSVAADAAAATIRRA
ncbi:Gfo/Idh/MocA family protein [Histidinibacterium lentulum]|uniref:Gfo/Idh/MocA family oxidoreductase n=1 Tax=Histidinibacterium lentulum TaxID=2480588 RepID=A0A3N2QTM1_9RHOB|nr:Gfo/Idh/MocA family oxidoreductase [Histidinibacterium lentulum]ROT98512.1 gfo/Idh/MocA family oxidoreductase [Histidinibacterium lentulum]